MPPGGGESFHDSSWRRNRDSKRGYVNNTRTASTPLNDSDFRPNDGPNDIVSGGLSDSLRSHHRSYAFNVHKWVPLSRSLGFLVLGLQTSWHRVAFEDALCVFQHPPSFHEVAQAGCHASTCSASADPAISAPKSRALEKQRVCMATACRIASRFE